MTISDEAVIAAGSAFYGPVWRDIVEERASGFEHAISQVRSMLEAAAPFIRAEALEEAAEAWQVRMDTIGRGSVEAKDFMRSRAAEMRQG